MPLCAMSLQQAASATNTSSSFSRAPLSNEGCQLRNEETFVIEHEEHTASLEAEEQLGHDNPPIPPILTAAAGWSMTMAPLHERLAQENKLEEASIAGERWPSHVVCLATKGDPRIWRLFHSMEHDARERQLHPFFI